MRYESGGGMVWRGRSDCGLGVKGGGGWSGSGVVE